MSAQHPVSWAREKRRKLKAMGASWVEWTTRARDVSLPGVPLAALAGFCANGSPYNTTGWRVGDDAERAEAERKGRRPFKRGLRGDYGGLDREGDLHEIGWWGTEAGKTPVPVATDPDCPWVQLATSADVVKVLGRPAVLGGAWYDAMPDQCAIGVANIARHLRAVRRRLDPRLQWDEAKPVSFWRFALAMMTWSAGGRGAAHVNAYAAELATLTEDRRWARFLELAATTDDSGNRHRQDEYSALRTAQKIEAARLFAPYLRDPWWSLTWGDDGLDDLARGRIYDRLVAAAKDYRE